ncbi:DUF397 domain-containing protein [Actinomadura bangladeshensis]|uniref:DUF397 domain-containing protein n=1 Tax=Actinomadura bangladeshensis TaxID=453573 RepID=A0A4R4PBM9_9ACTN|nr:DUF397 domain-containing protein [Actinomadura bangladeshensis]TDC18490.1 DUF397 domain-containing protein [Actinomadura bangladeshensis]
MQDVTWRKSRLSGSDGGSCVELASLRGGVAVRDSKDPDGAVLLVPRPVLRAALRGLTGR